MGVADRGASAHYFAACEPFTPLHVVDVRAETNGALPKKICAVFAVTPGW